MKISRSIVMLTVVAILCGGCGYRLWYTGTSRDIRSTDIVEQGEAIVVGRVHSWIPVTAVLKSYHRPSKAFADAYIDVDQGDSTKVFSYEKTFVMKVDADFIGYRTVLYGGPAHRGSFAALSEEKIIYTHAVEGQITYVGDLYVHTVGDIVIFQRKDEESETLRAAREMMPWVFEHYRLNEAAVVRPGSELDDQ